MELAIINGTYRDSSMKNGSYVAFATQDSSSAANQVCLRAAAGVDTVLQTPISIPALARPTTTTMGAPLIISPARAHLLSANPHLLNASPTGAPPLIPAESSLLYASPFEAYYHHHATLAAAQQHLLESYPTTTSTGAASDTLSMSGAFTR